MRIAVLGAGSWGTTLAILLHLNGHDVTLYEFYKAYAKKLSKTRINDLYLPNTKIPEEIIVTHSLDDACINKNMIVLAIPTQYLRGVLNKMKRYDFHDTTFVSVAKGIEKGTLLTVAEIIKDELPQVTDDYIGAISGPSHAEEVCRKLPTAVVAASSSFATAEEIQATFITSYFRVYSSTDIKGVELGGALKNVIAIAAGIADGANFGDNTKAAIMTRGIAEISRIGLELGATRETFAGLSGMGDLIVTCMSKHSRNRYVGEQIGTGKTLTQVLDSMKMVAEGVETCRSVHELSAKLQVETPIASAVYRVLFEEKDPVKATYDLMARDIRPEKEF